MIAQMTMMIYLYANQMILIQSTRSMTSTCWNALSSSAQVKNLHVWILCFRRVKEMNKIRRVKNFHIRRLIRSIYHLNKTLQIVPTRLSTHQKIKSKSESDLIISISDSNKTARKDSSLRSKEIAILKRLIRLLNGRPNTRK